MSSFDVEQGGINSRPDSHGVPDWVWMDGPGFSLCAALLESSGLLSVGIQTQWGREGMLREDWS